MTCSINWYLLAWTILLVGTSCRNNHNPPEKKIYDISAFSNDGRVQAIIEIPAGTTQKYEYDTGRRKFVQEKVHGKPRAISFLPYPGNYGFIPSTQMRKEDGGDGDALDVLVLGESAKRGDRLKIIPIAALLLIDEGEEDTKIIAIPVDSSLRIIPVDNFADFTVHYFAAQQIIEQWFLSYDPSANAHSKGWRDEKYAHALIQRYQTQEQ